MARRFLPALAAATGALYRVGRPIARRAAQNYAVHTASRALRNLVEGPMPPRRRRAVTRFHGSRVQGRRSRRARRSARRPRGRTQKRAFSGRAGGGKRPPMYRAGGIPRPVPSISDRQAVQFKTVGMKVHEVKFNDSPYENITHSPAYLQINLNDLSDPLQDFRAGASQIPTGFAQLKNLWDQYSVYRTVVVLEIVPIPVEFKSGIIQYENAVAAQSVVRKRPAVNAFAYFDNPNTALTFNWQQLLESVGVAGGRPMIFQSGDSGKLRVEWKHDSFFGKRYWDHEEIIAGTASAPVDKARCRVALLPTDTEIAASVTTDYTVKVAIRATMIQWAHMREPKSVT